MPVTSAADRWASKIVIVVQLVTWNAIGIVIIQSGVSTLQQRTLETTSHRTETNATVNLDVESTVPTERAENERDLTATRRRVIDKNAEDESSTQSLLNYSGASVTDRGVSNMLNNHLAEEERPVDYLESKSSWNKISRISRDKEREPQISNSIHMDSVSKPASKEEEDETGAKEKDPNFVETMLNNGPRFAELDRAKEATNIDSQFADIIWRNRNREKLYYVRTNDVTMGVGLVVIGCIMLLIGLAVIIIRILDEKRRAKGAYALSWEDPPPTYAEAVYLSEAPRYSTLALNE